MDLLRTCSPHNRPGPMQVPKNEGSEFPGHWVDAKQTNNGL